MKVKFSYLPYTDDIILTGDDEEIESLKKFLLLGSLKYFLDMEVAIRRTWIIISQRKYTLDLYKEVGMLQCKPGEYPIYANKKLGMFEKGKEVDSTVLSKIRW